MRGLWRASIVDNSVGFETLPAGSTMPAFTLEGTIAQERED